MGFPSLFKKSRLSSPPCNYSSSWQWPSCKHPRTQSFRAGCPEGGYKAVNSVCMDTSESWFTNSSGDLATDCCFFSASWEREEPSLQRGGRAGASMEAVIRAVRTGPADRLFFEPGGSSSIMGESKAGGGGGFPFEESLVVSVESEDPYADFRLSMEEMVAAHGVSDWACLEELLQWYLRVNDKATHCLIVGAFVDLLLELSSPSPSPSSCCCSSSPSISLEVDVVDLEGLEDDTSEAS